MKIIRAVGVRRGGVVLERSARVAPCGVCGHDVWMTKEGKAGLFSAEEKGYYIVILCANCFLAGQRARQGAAANN